MLAQKSHHPKTCEDYEAYSQLCFTAGTRLLLSHTSNRKTLGKEMHITLFCVSRRTPLHAGTLPLSTECPENSRHIAAFPFSGTFTSALRAALDPHPFSEYGAHSGWRSCTPALVHAEKRDVPGVQAGFSCHVRATFRRQARHNLRILSTAYNTATDHLVMFHWSIRKPTSWQSLSNEHLSIKTRPVQGDL